MTIDRNKLKASLMAMFVAGNGVNGAYAETPVQNTEAHKIEMTNVNSRDIVKLNIKDLNAILANIDFFNSFMEASPQKATEMAMAFCENVSKVGKVYDKNTVGISAENLEQALRQTGFEQEEIQQGMQCFYEKQGTHMVGFDAYRQPTRQAPVTGQDFVAGVVNYNGKMCDYQINKDGEVAFSQTPTHANVKHLMPKITENAQGGYDFGNVKNASYFDRADAVNEVKTMVLQVQLEHEVYRQIQSNGGAHSPNEQAFVNKHKEDMKVLGLEETKNNYLKQTNPQYPSDVANYQTNNGSVR